MKTRIFFAALSMVFSVITTKAQSHRGPLVLDLGASVNYYQGLPDRNFGKFENDRVNWQVNAMLGLTIAKDKAERRTMIAAFGGLGFNNAQTITNLLQDQQYKSVSTGQASTNNFYQVEGGVIIADLIRISTGVGQQNFNSQALLSSNGISVNNNALKYNSTTLGIKTNLCYFLSVNLNCNFEYGQDFNKTVIIPTFGLMFRL